LFRFVGLSYGWIFVFLLGASYFGRFPSGRGGNRSEFLT